VYPVPRLILVLVLALLAALPAAAQGSPRQVVSFEAPRELLEPTHVRGVMDEIDAFGVTQIRQLVYWKDFAPSPDAKRRPSFDAANPDAYPDKTFEKLDFLLALARERGISVHLTLTGPVPRWATRGKRDNVTRPIPSQFRAFATAVGRRYGGQVSTWSIWNEPNQPQFLGPQFAANGTPVSPGLYRSLYQAGVEGLRRTPENRGDTFLVGETSPRGNSQVVHPLRFLRRMLCLDERYRKLRRCAALDTDGYAHHAYTTSMGPRFVPPDPDDVTLGVLSRLERALDRAARARAVPRNLPVYLTEFGIQSYPDRVQGVSFPRQAAYMAIAEHMAYVNPRVRLFSQYLMTDDRPRRSRFNRYAGFESGLRRRDGTPKPAYAGFRLPLAVESYGRSDVLWGLVRPHRARTTITIEVAPKDRGFRTLKTLETTSTGVFSLRTRHRAGQRYRVRWTDPSGVTRRGAAVRSH
jgi:hypothetical protein